VHPCPSSCYNAKTPPPPPHPLPTTTTTTTTAIGLHESEKRVELTMYLATFPTSLEYIKMLKLSHFKHGQALRTPRI
jgi:hypothetical protein